jgi:uncharacterized membrane protein YgcG
LLADKQEVIGVLENRTAQLGAGFDLERHVRARKRGRGPDIRYLVAIIAGLAAMLSSPSAAAAASVVFTKGGNVWLAAPDGSNQRQVTTGGNWASPSQAGSGTIMALHGTQLVRLDRSGHVLAQLPTVFTNNSYSLGPATAAISPDGVNQAYDGEILTSPFCNPICVQNDTFSTWWGSATTYSQPNQTGGQGGYTNPAWIDNSHLLLTAAGIGEDGVATYTLGGGDNSEVPWFSDPALHGALLSYPAISASGDQLAFIASVSGGIDNEIRLYETTGPPPETPGDPANAPIDECNLVWPNNNFQAVRVSFSPDGQSLAYGGADGIHLLTLTAWPNCQGITNSLIIPGGSQPYFGLADVGPGDGSSGGGGGSNSGGGSSAGGANGGGSSNGAGGSGGGYVISNGFSVTGRAARGGVIALTVSPNAPGVFMAKASFHARADRNGGVRRRGPSIYGLASARVGRGGVATLTITPTRSAARALALAGRLVVSITLAFTPTGGTPRVEHLSQTVVASRGRHRRLTAFHA